MTPAAAFFQDIWVIVHDGVYEPADDTFMLCDHLAIKPDERFLEIGTGCGLIAIVAAKAGAQVVAVDKSNQAVQNARENVTLHKLHHLIEVRQGNFFEPINPQEKFSLLAFNPPYLPSTKEDLAYDSAWSGGATGHEVTEEFLSQCTKHLVSAGRLLLIQSSLSLPTQTLAVLEDYFQIVRVKAEKPFFFERLFLFEAENPV